MLRPGAGCVEGRKRASPQRFHEWPQPNKNSPKKVVLAYSGGLDTSIILKWLQQTYGCRGRHLHRRSRPGRGARARAREGAARRHQAGEHLHRGPARGVRARLRLPDVPRQHRLRGPVPARHLDRAAADRQEADRDRRTRSAPTRSVTAPPARATTRCASSSAITRSTPTSRSSRPGANGPSRAARSCSNFAREQPDPDHQGQGRRGAVLGRRQPAALVLGGQGAGGSRPGGAGDRLSAHHLADGGAGQADRDQHRLREGRRRQPQRPSDVAGDAARRAQQARPRQRHRPHRPGREPLRRHEVARRLRDARRHHPARRAPRHRIDHARPRRRPSQGRADAALRRADLQRLLVRARARDAAGG